MLRTKVVITNDSEQHQKFLIIIALPDTDSHAKKSKFVSKGEYNIWTDHDDP